MVQEVKGGAVTAVRQPENTCEETEVVQERTTGEFWRESTATEMEDARQEFTDYLNRQKRESA